MADLGDHVADPGDHDRPIRAITIRRCMHPDSRLGRFVQPMPPQLSDEDPDELLPPADQYESSEAD
jgi:hypothetical protein